MAFTQVLMSRPKSFGHMRMSFGSWTATSVTTGDINTGLRKCYSMMLTHKGSATEAAAAVVGETMPYDGSAVTITCTSSDAGYWLAFGY